MVFSTNITFLLFQGSTLSKTQIFSVIKFVLDPDLYDEVIKTSDVYCMIQSNLVHFSWANKQTFSQSSLEIAYIENVNKITKP